MNKVVYDGSWAGLLTTVFELYEYKVKDADICRKDMLNHGLFGDLREVITNAEKAGRVWTKLQKLLTGGGGRNLYCVFLSELPGCENLILRYISHALCSKFSVEQDLGHPDVLKVWQIARKVNHVKHDLTGFIRFEQLKDGLYFSAVEPEYNVLPLILPHFKNRFQDQLWLIYDVRRRYGLFYNRYEVCEVSISFNADSTSAHKPGTSMLEEDELFYQNLWKSYFKSVTIKSRKNSRLHIQQLPRKYWKYLTEKRPDMES